MANKFISGTFSDNGSSSAITILKNGVIKLGSSAATDFGSGTVKVQAMGRDGLYYNSATTYTAGDVVNIEFAEPTTMRLNLSGATAPSLAYEVQSDAPVITE